MMMEAIRKALEEQMEQQADDTTPSSIQRDKGLVWLEGWFDLSVVSQAAEAERAAVVKWLLGAFHDTAPYEAEWVIEEAAKAIEARAHLSEDVT
jgi:hypothetical protein